MLRNNNQEIAVRISRKNIRENRLRFGILVGVTAIFVMVFVVLQSGSRYFYDVMSQMSDHEAGIFHIGADGISEEEALLIRKQDAVKEAGIFIGVGEVLNRPLQNREIELGSADEFYMRGSCSFPDQGRMPEGEDEIALDATVLDALEIPRSLGEKVVLEWENAGNSFQKEFTVAGFWDGNQAAYKEYIWLSENFVNRQEHKVWNLTADLENPFFLKSSADKLEKNLGLPSGTIYVNERYGPEVRLWLLSVEVPFWIGMLFAFLCGKWILGTVFQLSVLKDKSYYENMKMQGMVSRQLKRILYHQAVYVCLFGILTGCILGSIFGNLIAGRYVMRRWDMPITFYVSSVTVPALLGVLMVLGAVRKPAKAAAGLLKQKSRKKKVRIQKKRRRITIWSMARREIRTRRGVLTVAVTLAFGAGLLCAADTMKKSYSLEEYLRGELIGDIIVEDRSLAVGHQYYNPYNRTIREELTEGLGLLGTTEQMGRLYGAESRILLTDRVHQNIIDYFEADEQALLDYMSYDEGWTESYYRMKETKECMAVILGTDSLVHEMFARMPMKQGTFDREKFESGGYVLSVSMGVSNLPDGRLPNYETGDKVKIEGRTFEVMAVADLEEKGYVLTQGSTSQEAAFSPFFIVPSGTFREMYPEHQVKKLFVEAQKDGFEETVQFLEDYKRNKNENLYMITRETVKEQFEQEVNIQVNMIRMLGAAIALAGLLNFIHSVTSGIWQRKDTFAALRSVGMRQRDIKKLVVTESLIFGGIIVTGAVVFGILAAGVGIRLYVSVGGFVDYSLSLKALWIFIPTMLAAAVIVPLAASKKIE